LGITEAFTAATVTRMTVRPLAPLLALAAICALGVFAVPSAGADECPDGWVCGVTAPPVPPDQAGDPQSVTIEAIQIPDVPPYVVVPMPVYSGPKACTPKHHQRAAHKKCKTKRK
jgi:hypothetical protein